MKPHEPPQPRAFTEPHGESRAALLRSIRQVLVDADPYPSSDVYRARSVQRRLLGAAMLVIAATFLVALAQIVPDEQYRVGAAITAGVMFSVGVVTFLAFNHEAQERDSGSSGR